MKSLLSSLAAILAGLMAMSPCGATTDATCFIYQPIDMRSDGTFIKLPEAGFIIVAIPYLYGFTTGTMPYDAIPRPHVMLSMREPIEPSDSNLVSRSGIKIQSDSILEGNKAVAEVVTVDLSEFRLPDTELTQAMIVEAALECIRRTATDERQKWPRPILKIIGKPADEAMWKTWEKAFNTQDFSKPFKQPAAQQKEGGADARADGNAPAK